MRKNCYTSDKVTQLINLPSWEPVTDIRNWDFRELTGLLAEDTQVDVSAYVAGLRIDFPHPIPNGVADVSLPALGNPAGALGTLGRLPLEVLWNITERMDLEAFLKFAQTSRLARSLCKENFAFKAIAKYMPSMLLIFKGLGLHKWIPVSALRGEMQQPKCRSCGENGHLLFVPTCERICINCLMYNPAYWCISPYDAKRAFALENDALLRLPVFRDTLRTYSVNGGPLTLVYHGLLVPIKSALRFAIEAHGSRDAMRAVAERDAPDRFYDNSATEQVTGYLHRYWRDTWLGKLPCDPTQVPEMHKDLPRAQSLFGLDIRKVATYLPFLPPTNELPVKLYRCKGCQFVLDHFEILPAHREYMGDADLDVTRADYARILRGRARIVRTWEEMKEHIPKCLGSGLRMWRRYVLSRPPTAQGSDI